MASTRALALASAQRMVDGVHRHATGLRSHALPAVPARLSELDQVRFGVADLADGGAAVDGDTAHLGRRKAERGEVTFLGDELHARTGAAGHFPSRTRLQLDVVDNGTDGDVAKRQCVAGADLRAVAGLQQVADHRAAGGEDVALLTVEVVQQEDATVAVGVVLDGGDLRRHAVLRALEVDDAVLLLVTATAVSGRLAAARVTAAGAVLRRDERPLGLLLR